MNTNPTNPDRKTLREAGFATGAAFIGSQRRITRLDGGLEWYTWAAGEEAAFSHFHGYISAGIAP